MQPLFYTCCASTAALIFFVIEFTTCTMHLPHRFTTFVSRYGIHYVNTKQVVGGASHLDPKGIVRTVSLSSPHHVHFRFKTFRTDEMIASKDGYGLDQFCWQFIHSFGVLQRKRKCDAPLTPKVIASKAGYGVVHLISP